MAAHKHYEGRFLGGELGAFAKELLAGNSPFVVAYKLAQGKAAAGHAQTYTRAHTSMHAYTHRRESEARMAVRCC